MITCASHRIQSNVSDSYFTPGAGAQPLIALDGKASVRIVNKY